MSKLLKCPFCGGEAEVGYANQHDKLFVVGCNTQMCYGNINHFTMVFVDKESAVKTWNTRKPMDNIVKKLEELKNRFSKEEFGTRGIIDKTISIVKQGINK